VLPHLQNPGIDRAQIANGQKFSNLVMLQLCAQRAAGPVY